MGRQMVGRHGVGRRGTRARGSSNAPRERRRRTHARGRVRAGGRSLWFPVRGCTARGRAWARCSLRLSRLNRGAHAQVGARRSPMPAVPTAGFVPAV